MDDEARIAAVMQYLRRTYANNMDGLKALAAAIMSTGAEAVTLTGHSAEGATVQGQITFEALAYLSAVEQVLLELDATLNPTAPTIPTPGSLATVIDFSSRFHAT